MRINSKLEDAEPSHIQSTGRLTYTYSTRYTVAVFAVAFFVLALVPLITHASVISFLSQLLGSSSAYADEEVTSRTGGALQAARNIDPNPSKGGGDITVVNDSALLSSTGPAGTLADIEERPTNGGQISIYVVREGDSLSQIARMFGVSTNTIIWANDIQRGSLIREGQTLVILPITGVRHTITKGDTLRSIAKKYDGDVDEIIQYNGLSEDGTLSVGTVITIPGGRDATPTYSGTTQIVRGSGGPTYTGYYIKPVINGRRSQGLHGYNGVDLAAPVGTPILAAATGDVIVVRNGGWNGGYGTYVVIRHDNGTQTLYAHNSKNIVYAGQRVVQGQVIGYVGNTGRSTGPHLHFEVRGAKNPF